MTIRLAIIALFLALPVLSTADGDPFAFFQPSLTLGADERRQLDRGEPIARIVPGGASQVAVFAATPIEIDGDQFVAWVRRIDELKKNPRVLAIGRFSDPPRIEDLAGLSLDDGDLEDIRSCRPGHCGVKLAAGEMAELQAVAAGAGDAWKTALQQAFRALVVQRVNAYLEGGLAALGPYADHDGAELRPAAAFDLLLSRSAFLSEHLPQLAGHLRRHHRTPMADVESFIYWSSERFSGKPVIGATHVSIVRNTDALLPDTVVTGQEIFATHYLNASLGVTAIVRGETGSHNYLAYLNRSEVDVLDGRFGGLVRRMVERRVKAEALELIRGLRKRLEAGAPGAD